MTKTCTSCFFKNFSKDQHPCQTCHEYKNYVTDSDLFWSDKPVTDKYEPVGALAGWNDWPFPSDSSPIPTAYEAPKALNTQVGGEHYKDFTIQPIEFIHANKLGFCEANVVKYITRWRDKGGKQDLEKVIHYVELLMQLEGL